MTIEERVSSLPIIEDVDDMLREGLTSTDVAKYIQETFELLRDVSFDRLAKALTKRREALPPPPPDPAEWPAAVSSVAEGARPPGRIASGMYQRAVRGIDTLLETESLYLAQRDRIDRMMTAETNQGAHFDDMPKEMGVALEMLKTHAKMQEQFGPAMERMRLSLEIQGSGAVTGLGQKAAMVMQDPESRHKVLSIFRRLSQVARVPVLDGEAEPIGGS